MCESCLKTFSRSTNEKSCDSCVAGKFGESAGVCSDCPALKFQKSKGQDNCESCQAGDVFTSSTTACISTSSVVKLPQPTDLSVHVYNKNTARIDFNFDSARQSNVSHFQISVQIPSERPTFDIPADARSFLLTNLTSPLWQSIIKIKITAVDKYNLPGDASDPTSAWTIASKCGSRQYLNSTATILQSWGCVPCPGKSTNYYFYFLILNAHFDFLFVFWSFCLLFL